MPNIPDRISTDQLAQYAKETEHSGEGVNSEELTRLCENYVAILESLRRDMGSIVFDSIDPQRLEKYEQAKINVTRSINALRRAIAV